MKILSVLSTSDLSAANQRMEQVFGRLREAGHEIHAVLPQTGPIGPQLEARGISVHLHRSLPVLDHRRPPTFASRLRILCAIPASVFFLARLIRQCRIQIVHTNSLSLPTPSLAAWITRKPHLWHARELLNRDSRLWPIYQRWVHLFSAAIVAVSGCTRSQFQKPLRRKIKLIYDGLDIAAATPDINRVAELRELFPPQATLIGIVGAIEWLSTGHEVLIRAASILRDKHPDAHYLFAGSPGDGDEDHIDRLRELIATYGLEDVFQILPMSLDPVSVFAALDIVVFPPVEPEPFVPSILEAMAAGTPIVASRSCSISEQILDGVTGLLFPPGDESSLATELDLLLRDQSLRDRMGQAGRQRVRISFSFEQTCHSMDVLLEQVMNSHS